MVWTKLGDTFADNMDADGISTDAFTLHVAAYIFCNRMGTDGFIPRHMTRRLYSAISDIDQSTKELLASDRWVEADMDGKSGYEIVGFLDDQDSADMVAHRQEQRKEATRRWRARVQGYPETSNGQSKINSDASRDQSPVIQKHHGDALPPRPAPSRPKEAGKGREGTTAAGSPGGSPLPTSLPGDGKKKARPQPPGWPEFDTSSYDEGGQYDVTVAEVDFSIEVVPAEDSRHNPVAGYTDVNIWAHDERLEVFEEQQQELTKAVTTAVQRWAFTSGIHTPKTKGSQYGEATLQVPDAEVDIWVDRIAEAFNDPKVLKLIQRVAGNFSTDTSDQTSPETSR
jgi:hypothetical protein